jgi:dTDP-4-amino-4,6-dideoxygalactose transaminase
MSASVAKREIGQLAILGGPRLFDSPKPTSNLVRPDKGHFFKYAAEIPALGHMLVPQLESRLATMHGVRHCVAMCSGFWALALAIDALRVEGRTEVILPSLTYRRMADIVAWLDLIPHFCDIEPHTLANSARTVTPCLSSRTALLIGVHPVGGHCDIDGLVAVSTESGVPLIFDSVESAHERHRGVRIGGFGNAELFSLGASKLINGFEGGYVTTHDPELAERLRRMARGMIERPGGHAMSVEMIEIHAAMALAAMDDLDAQVSRNRLRFEAYKGYLADVDGLRLLASDPTNEPSYKNIVVEVLDRWPLTRDQTIDILNAELIFARAYYSPPLTHKRMTYPYVAGSLPHTDWAADRYISMPCGHLVTLDDIDRIVGLLRFVALHADRIKARL